MPGAWSRQICTPSLRSVWSDRWRRINATGPEHTESLVVWRPVQDAADIAHNRAKIGPTQGARRADTWARSGHSQRDLRSVSPVTRPPTI